MASNALYWVRELEGAIKEYERDAEIAEGKEYKLYEAIGELEEKVQQLTELIVAADRIYSLDDFDEELRELGLRKPAPLGIA